jgi:hypothetical protein
VCCILSIPDYKTTSRMGSSAMSNSMQKSAGLSHHFYLPNPVSTGSIMQFWVKHKANITVTTIEIIINKIFPDSRVKNRPKQMNKYHCSLVHVCTVIEDCLAGGVSTCDVVNNNITHTNTAVLTTTGCYIITNRWVTNQSKSSQSSRPSFIPFH